MMGGMKAHGLPEDVAQGQHMKKAYGVENPFVLAVLGDLALNRVHAAENVAVCEHHAARLRRGS